MKTKIILPFLSILILLIPSAFAAKAEAVLKGTAENSSIAGTVHFEEANGELKITAEVSGAPAGTHGFHIHENGSCDESGKAAGGHFNPDNVKHGLLLKDGFSAAHAGDLGNIEVRADGKGKLVTSIGGLTLAVGKYDVGGKSVILHEKADNFGQPTGNAGGRIACGVIEKEKTAEDLKKETAEAGPKVEPVKAAESPKEEVKETSKAEVKEIPETEVNPEVKTAVQETKKKKKSFWG